MSTFKFQRTVAACTAATYLLFGCGTVEQANRATFANTQKTIQQAQEKAPDSMPVVTTTAGAWLMGETVQVAPPVSPLLQQAIAWRPAGRVSLVEVGTHLAQESGLIVDTSEVQVVSTAAAQPGGAVALPGTGGAGAGAASLARPQDIFGAMQGQSSKLPEFTVAYEGTRAGLLDYAANKSGVWWKFADGKVTFFRALTETIYIPAAARKSTGSATIAATSGPGNGSSGASGSGSNNVTAGTSTGGLTSTDDYTIDVWADLEKTAKVVAGGSCSNCIATNKALSSITVTGTPVQVKNVREWARGLTDNLSQQVAITATMYTVDVTNEDYYSWDPTIIFNKLTSAYSFGFTGAQSPAIQSSVTPAGIGVSVLNNATTGARSNLSGTQLAMQALSSLGHVSSTLHGSVVTMNGVKAPMQIGRQIGYIPSTSTTTSSNVGATTSIQTGSITVGFTANFYPQIINGKILLSMDVINSALDRLPTRTSGNASVQTPETSSSSFSQSVSLTPGDAIMLTGFSQDSGQTSKTGVGSPTNPIFGGGTDAVATKKMIAIVISAKVL